MTDPLETLLVETKWHAIELKQDRGGDYLQEAETGNGITLAELVKRYNALLRSPAPAQGWRLLNPDEIICNGDECYSRTFDAWTGTSGMVGGKCDEFIIRRRLTPPAQGDEMRALADKWEALANEAEKHSQSWEMISAYLYCAKDLRSAVAAVRGAGGEGVRDE